MSEAYERSLVVEGSSAYERVSAAVVGVSFVAFLAAIGTFFGWVPLAENVAGFVAARYFGAVLVALGFAVAGLGVASRVGMFETAPDDSAGLVAAVVFGMLWFLTLGFVAQAVGIGAVGWIGALAAGVGLAYATLVSSEDIGSTFPVAGFLLFMGALFVAGAVTPESAWMSEAFEATFPGTVVIPTATIMGALLGGWTGAKAYAGYGTRGRQNGAFLLISLVVFLVLSILVLLLAFVFERGVAVVLENLIIGAGTALAFVALPVVLLSRRAYRRGIVTGTGTDAVSSYVRFAFLAVFVLLAAGLGYAFATATSLSYGSVTLEPTTAVGALPALVVSGVLLLVARAADTSTAETDREQLVARLARLVVAGLVAGALVELFVAEIGVPGVPFMPIAVAAVAAVSLVALVASYARDVPYPRVLPVTVLLWASVVAAVHVLATGDAVAVAGVGIVEGGTVNWPFLMNPSQGLGIQIGVMPAMFGTIWIVLGAVVFAVPLAVGAAVYLTEYAEDSLFTRGVDVATNGLWSTPSIVFGLFGLAFIVPRFGDSPSILASQLVLGFMLLPLVLITSREAMKSVPDEYRDASAALGVSKWRTIRSVVVPAAMPGVITGVILGVGRIAGETAPLLLVLNGPNFPGSAPGVLSSFDVGFGLQPPFIHVSNPALLERASALPYQLYAVITAGVGAEESFGWGTALVLLGVVLSFFAVSVASRRYFRRKLQQ
ncbi:phosphate ABC transporter permease PstA [Halorutilus salinus]|uniref:phosphate ABC transporter permease PstA n=1 Tax=Halorutilus salinus TaxID=2487751 RepID=UPI0023EEE3AA|nr:phosphate ABC transporter permease PstA [Halorutilus salinus]